MLHCPDLGASHTNKIVEDYCIHSNLIIFDIININVATGDTKHSESEGHTNNDLQQNRIKIECCGINIFLKEGI
jgi:hypothetical protein